MVKCNFLAIYVGVSFPNITVLDLTKLYTVVKSNISVTNATTYLKQEVDWQLKYIPMRRFFLQKVSEIIQTKSSFECS